MKTIKLLAFSMILGFIMAGVTSCQKDPIPCPDCPVINQHVDEGYPPNLSVLDTVK